MLPPEHRILPALRRLCAAGSAVLVLALAIFAVSPRAHAWIHDDDGHEEVAHQDDSCAVVLFASGVSLEAGHAPLRAPDEVVLPAPAAAPDELFLAQPRYLRQPERGPPGC